MNSPLLALRIAAWAFGLIAFAHFLRLLTEASVRVGQIEIGLIWSVPAIIVTGGLSAWMHHLVLQMTKEHSHEPEHGSGHQPGAAH